MLNNVAADYMAPGNAANYRFKDYVVKVRDFNTVLRIPGFKYIGEGEVGGKARGLAVFADALAAEKESLAREFKGDVVIAVPKATVIRTSVFSDFLDKNNLWSFVRQELPNDDVDRAFLAGKFTAGEIGQFDQLLQFHERPLAVRSSHLLEDAERKPWAGIFRTFIIPNSHASLEVRREQLTAAIKLVFASTYHANARAYAKENHMLGGESPMAVLMQNVAGRRWPASDGCDVYYPEVSFAGFSFNHFATKGLDAKDGFMRIACGLGKGVVDNQPGTAVIINLGKPDPIAGISVSDLKGMFQNTPRYFYALRLDGLGRMPSDEDSHLVRLELPRDANEELVRRQAKWFSQGRLSDSDRLGGTPLVLFKSIVERNSRMVAAVRRIMGILKNNLGMDVDIEGAADFWRDNGINRTIIYPLQGRVQVRSDTGRVDALPAVSEEKVVLRGKGAVGPGNKEIWGMVVVPQDKFSFGTQSSRAAGDEILRMNAKLTQEFPQKKYMLVVPGRFGSSDPFLGIHGEYSHVSHAGIVAEIKLGRIDSSQGMHFFQDLVSSRTSVLEAEEYGDLKMGNLVKCGQVVESGEHVVRYHFEKPFKLEIDKQGNYLIYAT
jgi:hypothetical protein